MALRPEEGIGQKIQRKIGLTYPCPVKTPSKIAKVKMRGKCEVPHAGVLNIHFKNNAVVILRKHSPRRRMIMIPRRT